MATYAAGFLHAHLVTVAEEHRQECRDAACRTCEGLKEPLAMMLAFVRVSLDTEMREHMKAPLPAAGTIEAMVPAPLVTWCRPA